MKKHFKMKLFLAGAVLGLGLAGCGSSSQDSFALTGAQPQPGFTVTEPTTLQRDGDVVDSVELEAFDAQGNRLQIGGVLAQTTEDDYEPVILPFSTTMNFPPLPEGTASVDLDYLRNGGYTLYRATMPASAGGGLAADPDEQPTNASTSKWELEEDGSGGFSLKVTPTNAGVQGDTTDYTIKGICYSPCPINVLGDGAPNIGDFFFDEQINPVTGNPDFFNSFGLWGKGSLGDGFYARQDIERIRDLKANTIRTYSMLSRQQNDRIANPELPEFPDPETKYHFQHKAFLDRCWDNGDDPVYVIVGIPTPPDMLYESLQNNTPEKIAFYDFVLRETIADLANHPAVLGFTIQNEVNDGKNAFPGTGPGGQMAADNLNTGLQNSASDFYWGKVKEHSDYAKATAPDKLVGMVVHDFREIAQYASNFPTPQDSYLARASNLDFAGINTYQTVNYNDQYDKGWGAVTGAARKAVLFSELGFPATTREGNDPTTIHDTAESRQNTADLVAKMLPQAFTNSVSIGACYFEFSDEWWKQVEDSRQEIINGETETIRNVHRWYGGNAASGFPNGFWDEEGFGLFSIARYEGLENSDPVIVYNNNGDAIGPDRRFDRLTERTEITSVVQDVFESL